MKSDFQHLSPAIGAALCNSLVIINLYNANRYCDSNELVFDWKGHTFDPIQNSVLVRELFFHPAGEDSLRVTNSKTKPAYWLTPNLIGRLIAFLQTNGQTPVGSEVSFMLVRVRQQSRVNMELSHCFPLDEGVEPVFWRLEGRRWPF